MRIYVESIDSLKLLSNLVKDNDTVEFVGGYIDGQYYDAQKMTEIASLPSKTDLLSMFLSVLQAPMRNLAYSISQIESND